MRRINCFLLLVVAGVSILACQGCGKITDIEESALEPLWTEIQQSYNFKVDMKHLAFFGLCVKCRE